MWSVRQFEAYGTANEKWLSHLRAGELKTWAKDSGTEQMEGHRHGHGGIEETLIRKKQRQEHISDYTSTMPSVCCARAKGRDTGCRKMAQVFEPVILTICNH